jgi:signal transduction histidine kinase
VIRSLLEVAREEILRLERLALRVLEIRRRGRARLKPRLSDLGEVVSNAVRRAIPAEFGVPVRIDVKPRALVGWWDVGAVEQIVQNLLSNALKFGNGKSIDVAVERARPGGACLRVRDRGPGMAAADRARILRRDLPLAPPGSGGLGLGLWLVRGLAESHGGRVAIESHRGAGSVFTVTLRPLRRIARQPRDGGARGGSQL